MDLIREKGSLHNRGRVFNLGRTEVDDYHKGAELSEKIARFIVVFKKNTSMQYLIDFKEFIKSKGPHGGQSLIDCEHATGEDIELLYHALKKEFDLHQAGITKH